MVESLKKKQNFRASQSPVDVTLNFDPLQEEGPPFHVAIINTTAVEVFCNHHICVGSMNSEMYTPILKIIYRPIMNMVVWSQSNHCEIKNHEGSWDENRTDVRRCKDTVFKFGDFNDSITKDYSEIERHCVTKVAYLKAANSDSSQTLAINGLLPHQAYVFMYRLEYKDNSKTVPLRDFNHTDKVCMPGSKPLAPPQTDLGSFSIESKTAKKVENDEKLGKFRKVTLHWRPIPELLVGDAEVYYMLTCYTKIGRESVQVISPKRIDGKTGMHTFSADDALYTDTSYTCYLQAANALGYVDRVSPIVIPSSSSIIDVNGKFHFYVTRLDKLNKFDLRWNSIEEIIRGNQSESLLRTNMTNQIANSYTIYWCESNFGCPEILGMVKTRETTYDLTLHNDRDNRDLTFGISYRSANNQKFTGIIWASCVANIRNIGENLTLSWLHTAEDTSIYLKWSPHSCVSILSLYDYYEIEYCQRGDVDQCLVPSIDAISDDHKEFMDKSVCTTIKVENNLQTDMNLTDLKPSTVYVLRAKHWSSADGTLVQGDWCKPIMAFTKSPRCDPPWDNTTMMITLGVVLLVIIIIAWPVMRSFKHYGRMLKLFYNAKCSIPFRSNESDSEEADNLSVVGLTYHINRLHIVGSLPCTFLAKEDPNEVAYRNGLHNQIDLSNQNNTYIKGADQIMTMRYNFHVEGLMRADQWQHNEPLDQKGIPKTDDSPEARSEPSSGEGSDSVSISSFIQYSDAAESS